MKLRILTVPVLIALTITTASAQYIRTDLVSNQPGVAPTTDPRLANGWGLVALPTSPYWVSDNDTGFSTLYTATGQQIPLFVTIPPAPGSPAGTLGTPTGIVGNISPNATDFTVNWIAANILRIEDGLLVEHWDVIQDEAHRRAIGKVALPLSGNP